MLASFSKKSKRGVKNMDLEANKEKKMFSSVHHNIQLFY
jgi:hypothetical protein